MSENGHLQVTPANEWKRQAELVKLPSGKVARLQRPDISDLILEDGSIPDALAGLMAEVEQSGGALGMDKMPEALGFANKICARCFMEPKVLLNGEPNYDAGEIGIADVGLDDRFFVTQWAMDMGQALKLARFPEEPVSDVQPVPAVQDIPTSTE